MSQQTPILIAVYVQPSIMKGALDLRKTSNRLESLISIRKGQW